MGRTNPCPDPGGAGIFLQQQSNVSYCCLSSQIPALFQGHPPLPSSAQPGCEHHSACDISLSQGTCSFSPPSPLFLALHFGKDTENMDSFVCFFFKCILLWRSLQRTGGPGPSLGASREFQAPIPIFGQVQVSILGSPYEDEFPCPKSTYLK